MPLNARSPIVATVVAATTLIAALPAAVAQNATATPATCSPLESTTPALTCDVPSASMGRDISVVVKPGDDPDKVVQFLDGIEGGDSWSDVALPHLSEETATVVFPSAEERSFWVDWDVASPPNNLQMSYETFLTQELPAYLTENFRVSPNPRTGVLGISMGAYSAVNLASKRPGTYTSVLAMSGFYNNQDLAGRAITDLTTLSHGENNTGIPWTDEASRADDNPWHTIDNLTADTIITTATGVPHPEDWNDHDLPTVIGGGVLEAGTLGVTGAYDLWSRLHHKENVETIYIPTGTHSWGNWTRAAFTEQKLYWRFSAAI